MGKVFEIYISFLNLLGTISAVWSVIRIRFSGLMKSTSAANIFHPDLNAMKTKIESEKGLFIVILSFIYGAVNTIFEIESRLLIISLIAVSILLIIINNKLLNALFKATLIAYDHYLEDNGKEQLIPQLRKEDREKFEQLKNDKQPFKHIIARYARDEKNICK